MTRRVPGRAQHDDRPVTKHVLVKTERQRLDFDESTWPV